MEKFRVTSRHWVRFTRRLFNPITVTVEGGGVKLPPGQFFCMLFSNPCEFFEMLQCLFLYVFELYDGIRLFSTSGSKIQHGGRKTGSCIGWMAVCCVWRFLGLLRVTFSWYFDFFFIDMGSITVKQPGEGVKLPRLPKTVVKNRYRYRLIVMILRDQRPWRRYALYWVSF